MGDYLKNLRSEGPEEATLTEALGCASAYDVLTADKKKVLLHRGVAIGPHDIARLAAEGIGRIFIYRKPRVSIIVVGSGLIPPGLPQRPGKIYDFSTEALRASLETMRIRPVFTRRVPEEPKKLDRLMTFALSQSDIVILVMKEFEQDLKAFLQGLRPQFVFPKKPLGPGGCRLMMHQGKKPVFCLPYDSDQIFECFDKFIRPAVKSFMGYSEHPRTLNVA